MRVKTLLGKITPPQEVAGHDSSFSYSSPLLEVSLCWFIVLPPSFQFRGTKWSVFHCWSSKSAEDCWLSLKDALLGETIGIYSIFMIRLYSGAIRGVWLSYGLRDLERYNRHLGSLLKHGHKKIIKNKQLIVSHKSVSKMKMTRKTVCNRNDVSIVSIAFFSSQLLFFLCMQIFVFVFFYFLLFIIFTAGNCEFWDNYETIFFI